MKSIRSRFKVLVTAFVAFGISACATPLTSNIDTADNANFSTYKTYAWISDRSLNTSAAGHSTLVNPINESRIRSSIDDELARKGYKRVSLDNADLAIGYTLGARDKVIVRNNYDDFGYGYYGGFNRFGFSRFGYSRFATRFNRFGGGFRGIGPSTTVRTVTEGTLAVDVFDNAAKEALWHGAASRRLSRDENGRELISEAVGTLLGEFPDSTAPSATVIDQMDHVSS